MTWVSHSVVTFATMFMVTHDVFIAGSAMLGSTFPDRVEGPLWKLCHRSYSHWFVFYVVAMVLCWTPSILSLNYMQLWSQGIIWPIRLFLFWFFSGSLFHILEDAVCGPVPFLRPTKRKRILPQLFNVGTFGEFVFVIIYLMILCMASQASTFI